MGPWSTWHTWLHQNEWTVAQCLMKVCVYSSLAGHIQTSQTPIANLEDSLRCWVEIPCAMKPSLLSGFSPSQMYQRKFWVVKIHMLFLVGAMKCQFIRAPVKTWDILFGHPTNSRSSKVNAMLFTIPIKKLYFDHPKVIFKCKSRWFSCQSSI